LRGNAIASSQLGTQLRRLASALGLSPDARGRCGIKEIEPIDDENSDLLTSPARFLT
jgi:phage terminase small subunit